MTAASALLASGPQKEARFRIETLQSMNTGWQAPARLVALVPGYPPAVTTRATRATAALRAGSSAFASVR